MLSFWIHRMPWRGAMLLAALGLLPISAAERPASSVTRSDEAESRRPLEVSTYEEKGGDAYAAISVKLPDLQADEPSRTDHVLLFDTSASQVGEHRKQALAVAKAFLDSLPADHRLAVYAVDLKTHPLTDGFVPVGGDEATLAMNKLNRRLPLGATNLSSALDRALEDLEAGPQSSILYIGDGMSAANLLPEAELRELTQKLHDARVPVHSYAVGPRKDLQLLGAMAQQTGGYVKFDMANDQTDSPSRLGRQLADAVTAPIHYPESVNLEPAGLFLLPSSALPLRADRSTVYLAKGRLPEELSVRISGEEPRKFTVAKADFETGQTFLRTQHQQAEQTGGLSVAFAGNRMLRAAQANFDNQVAALVEAGEQAVARREFDRAEEIGLAIKKADPQNVNVQVLLGAADKAKNRARTVAFQQPPDEESLLNQPQFQNQPEGIDNSLPEDQPGEGLIPDVQQIRQIKTERLTLEVNSAIEEAENLALTSPEEALDVVKLTLGNVESATDIIPEARAQLLRRLRSLQLELRNRQTQMFENQRMLAERQAAIEAQQRLVDLATQEELELERLIDRVRAAMEEGYHGQEDAFERAEAVARAAVQLKPGEGTAAAALFSAEAAGQLDKAFRLRALRADKFLETLYQVELSHVPFPDEPPIVWPPAEVWQALTERRKKWASVDLKKNSPAEEKIQSALIDPQGVDISFIDTPLSDAMDFLADAHDITIIIDEVTLNEENVPPDTPIDLELSGITLRSALKIMLEPLGLTYIIEDEVMKITTIIAAEEKLTTRVYPVGDLVIPITTPQAGGLGQGLGGVGGLGGGGGGAFGGGQFGGGGGGGLGGGIGGGIGGGGIFNIPPQAVPQQRRPAPANAPNGNAVPQGKPRQQRRPADPEIDNLLDRILDEKTSQTSFQGQWFAQIQDGGFRLDNETVEELKKKVT